MSEISSGTLWFHAENDRHYIVRGIGSLMALRPDGYIPFGYVSNGSQLVHIEHVAYASDVGAYVELGNHFFVPLDEFKGRFEYVEPKTAEESSDVRGELRRNCGCNQDPCVCNPQW